jgi:small-conductance mechanosensitive channel
LPFWAIFYDQNGHVTIKDMSFIDNPVVQIVIVVIVAYVLHRFSGYLVSNFVHRILIRHDFETISDRSKQEDTLRAVFRTAISLIIFLTAFSVILAVLHFNFAQIATGAGFLGIIIGIGAQTTIRDYLAGIFILTENQYRVGDIITLAGSGVGAPTSGVIEDISLRITKLRDLDGALHIIRNGEASIITNRTYKYSSVVIDVGVAYDSDIDLVEKIMNDVGKHMLRDPKLAKVIIEPIGFLRVDAFGSSAVMIKTLGKVIPSKQWDIAGEYRRRLLAAFNDKGIEIVLPQIVVHNAKTKK